MKPDEPLDKFDRVILRALQRDGSMPTRELAEIVGLSQNACWRRLARLRDEKIIQDTTIRIDPEAVGLGLTVFVMVRTRHHSESWLQRFRDTVLGLENVVDCYRIAGDYDYMLKVMARDMNDFDRIYQSMIAKLELETVTSYITMEAIADRRDLKI